MDSSGFVLARGVPTLRLCLPLRCRFIRVATQMSSIPDAAIGPQRSRQDSNVNQNVNENANDARTVISCPTLLLLVNTQSEASTDPEVQSRTSTSVDRPTPAIQHSDRDIAPTLILQQLRPRCPHSPSYYARPSRPSMHASYIHPPPAARSLVHHKTNTPPRPLPSLTE